MAEFPSYPITVGKLPADNWWDELRASLAGHREFADIDGSPPGSTPAAITEGDLWKRIAEYRADVDNLAPFFYSEASVVANNPVAYTATTLHNEAFGEDGWQGTLPGSPQIMLWNDIYECLLLLGWARIVNNQFIGSSSADWGRESIATPDHHSAPWADALADHYATAPALSNKRPIGAGLNFGRQGEANDREAGNYNFNLVRYTEGGRNVSLNLSGLSATPTVEDSYAVLKWSAQAGEDYYKDLAWEVVLGHTSSISVSNAPTASDGENAGEGWNRFAVAHLGDIHLDGTANEIRFVFSPIGDWDIAPSITDWPAPTVTVPNWDHYWQRLTQPKMYWYLKLSWV